MGLALLGANGKACVPEHLANRPHDDWYFFQSTSRGVNFFCAEEPPILVLGSSGQTVSFDGITGPTPVPPIGAWQLTLVQVRKSWPFYLPYAALSTPDRRYCAGLRWDNVDHYFVLSLAGHRQTSKGSLPQNQPTGFLFLAFYPALQPGKLW